MNGCMRFQNQDRNAGLLEHLMTLQMNMSGILVHFLQRGKTQSVGRNSVAYCAA